MGLNDAIVRCYEIESILSKVSQLEHELEQLKSKKRIYTEDGYYGVEINGEKYTVTIEDKLIRGVVKVEELIGIESDWD